MNIGIISIYPPPKSKHAKLGGVGSYTKNLMDSLKTFANDYYIYSDKTRKKMTEHIDDDITIFYCWDSASIKYPFQIIYRILKQKTKLDLIHIQYEVFLYGGILSAITFPLLITLLRLLKIPVVLTIHQVLPISKIDNTFLSILGVKGSPYVFKKGLKILLNFICFFSNSIIVHETLFKSCLINEYGFKRDKKINVIPHGIEEQIDLIDAGKAKEKLQIKKEYVVLFFGYLSKYKGIEIFLDSFKYLHRDDILFIIAGGVHPRLKNDQTYIKYINSLKKRIQNKNIIFTGFVEEDKINLYFSAADLVVFPYTIVMSSSGPMALAIAYEKPFLASSSYKNMLNDEILFEKDAYHLARKINTTLESKKSSQHMQDYIKELKRERLWKEIGKKHYRIYKNLSKSKTE